MPIITFTQNDKMAAVTLEAGWYTAIITRIDGPKQSKSGNSINWWTDFTVQGGKYDGKELTVVFNSEMSTPSVLGTLQFMPQHQLLGIRAAIEKVKVSEVTSMTFDTDELMHKPLDIKVEPATAGEGGGLINIITEFLPSGAGANQGKLPF